MRLGYAPWGETLDELCSASAAAEAAGFSHVWLSELHRTAFVPAAAVARATSGIGVGTAVALAFVRSPLITALTALDLDELSGGRFTLGLGSGVRRLNEDWHGADFERPARRLRERVAIIRRVVAESHLGKPIETEGMRLRGFERPFPPLRERIPIYLAAVGPVMTRLAGEIADGWLGHELGSPRHLREQLLPNLGAAGRRPEVDVVASACCVIDRDAAQAKRWAAGLVAFYASVRTYQPFFAYHGFEKEAVAIQDRFRAGDEAGMIDACPGELVDALTLAGTADDVRARISSYDGLADGIKLSPPAHLVGAEVTRHCQKQILETFGP